MANPPIIKMGKNVKIVVVAALLIFFTLTQSAPARTTEEEIAACLTGISDLRHHLKIEMARVEENTTSQSSYRGVTRRTLGTERGTLREALESTDHWSIELTYEQLKKLAITDRRWLPVCIAHEYLIVERAQYDMERLKHYMSHVQSAYEDSTKARAARRLSLYNALIKVHESKIADLLLRSGTVGTSELMVASTVYVDRPTLDLLEPHREDDGDAPHPIMFDFFRLADEQPVESRLEDYSNFIVEREEIRETVRGGDTVGTSDPMVTSTYYVDRPTLDLLGRGGIDRTSDLIDRPLFDFLGQSDE
ncbi:hypothetical protein SeLEV6574_g04683 [Synchytrium endobioticum]|nr:avrSen1 variant 2 [Synchytrium endobioticum]TPX44154.1 hypothetical protein SeLEV6574_g04683 [Synchytrium endobioticum]